jgi:hypothetical protein
MNHKKGFPIVGVLIFIMVLITGCQDTPPQAQELYERTIAALTGEDHYRYSGDTTIEVNGVKMESMVEFDGFVTDHNRVYMNLTMQTGGGETEKFTLFSNNKNIFIRQQEQWNSLEDGEDAYIAQQFRQWDPVANFRELISIEKTVEIPVDSVQAASTHNRITVHIKPEEMKRIIVAELRGQFEASMGKIEDINRLKQSLKLSEQEFQQMKQQVEESIKQSQMELDRLIQSLDVNAVYYIEVNPKTWHPEQLQMSVQSRYQSSNGPVEENTLVTYRFEDFGQKFDVPLPSS